MLPEWISVLGTRLKKMQKPPTNGPQNEQLMEEGQKEVPNFAATFLAGLHSNRVWDDTIEGGGVSKTKEQETKGCLTHFFSSVYSVGQEPAGPPETLKVVEMYVRKDTPFEWTGECMDLDLEKMIEAYNSIAKGMEITLHEDGITFGGPVRVNIDLSRPIEIVESVAPPPVQNTENPENSTDKPTPTVKITGVLLDQNTTEVIGMDSKATAKQLIVKVFKKLGTVNYPREYALYEYEPQIDETAGTLTKKLTRIADDACPLKVVLNWPVPHSGRALVLQEKERDVQKNTGKVEMSDIYSKVTGLNKEQVDVKNKKKSRTGLFETTLSKRVPSKTEKFWESRCGAVVMFLLLIGFPALFTAAFVLLFPPSNLTGPKEIIVRGFLEKNLEEFLKNFYEEMEKSKLLIVSQTDTSPNPQ